MSEQEQPATQESAEKLPLQDLGDQGNTGQYGQGQYTSEGKPDMQAPEGQRLKPANPTENSNDAANDAVPLEDLQVQENEKS